MYKTEGGFRAFYKGFYPSTTAMMISSGIYFYSYDKCKALLRGDNSNKLAIFSSGIIASMCHFM